jgi:glycosyltransferase involved in cell wall biosynthesis
VAADEGAGEVSAIVTTRDSALTLEACLVSLKGQDCPDAEVIVVDNNSSDGTLEIARRFADKVVTHGPKRSAQRNFGASLVVGECLLFVDSDMRLHGRVISEAVRTLRMNEAPAVIIPEVSFGEGFWTQCRALERICYIGDNMVEAARFYRRDVFERVGGFDEALTGGEDWYLSRRVAGQAVLPRTRSVIGHDDGCITLRSAYCKRRYYAPGYIAYLRKHGRARSPQRNPIIRAAYLRNWRMLGKHPLLTAGMVVLKSVEAAAVVPFHFRQVLRGG